MGRDSQGRACRTGNDCPTFLGTSAPKPLAGQRRDRFSEKFDFLVFFSVNLAEKGRTSLQAKFRILIRYEARKLDFCEQLME